MLVPRTAKGFRATISALQFLDWSKGVSFHTFSLPETLFASAGQEPRQTHT
jgi:hypothetical protein